MSFRWRVTLVAGAATLVVVVAVSAAVYLLVRRDLREQIDESLANLNVVLYRDIHPGPGGEMPETPEVLERPDRPERPDVPANDRYVQIVDTDGEVVQSWTEARMPVTDAVVEVARGERSSFYYEATVDGTPVRIRVTPQITGSGARYAQQSGRSLEEMNESLRQLAATLGGLSLGAVGLALALGRLVASTAVAPVHRLSAAAETIARSGDLSHHINVRGRDELARLAGSFNTMLDALDASLAQQRQLVADASHELRTPLTSVRTNIEVLQRSEAMDPAERQQLLADVVAQIGELTRLVEDLVELAREEDDRDRFEPLALEDVVADVIERARRNHPGLRFEVTARPSVVRGSRQRIDRAVTNLVDNAAKWSPAGGRVDVGVGDGTVAVDDEGPGIDPADVPHVFDRFYRSTTARSMPGSGLGLAIVKQVADSHGGTSAVGTSPAGGARVELRLPTA